MNYEARRTMCGLVGRSHGRLEEGVASSPCPGETQLAAFSPHIPVKQRSAARKVMSLCLCDIYHLLIPTTRVSSQPQVTGEFHGNEIDRPTPTPEGPDTLVCGSCFLVTGKCPLAGLQC